MLCAQLQNSFRTIIIDSLLELARIMLTCIDDRANPNPESDSSTSTHQLKSTTQPVKYSFTQRLNNENEKQLAPTPTHNKNVKNPEKKKIEHVSLCII